MKFYRVKAGGGRGSKKEHKIWQSLGKNRFWLRTTINGKTWHVGRLIAWAFSNPRNLSWDVFAQTPTKYHALHISLDETNFCCSNLKMGTKRQNAMQYKDEARAKHGAVRRC